MVGNQTAMDGFVQVFAGVKSPAEFHSEANVGRIFAAAAGRGSTSYAPRLRPCALVGSLAYQADYSYMRRTMSVAKITEIQSSSKKSFEDAINSGIARADKTLKNLTGAWIKSQQVVIAKGKVVEYRVLMKVTFVLND